MLGSKSAKCITPILALSFLFGCNDNSTDISSMFQVEQPKPVSSSNQGTQPKPVSNSNQGVQPKPVSTSNQGAQPKPVSTSNQGAQPKPVSTSNQGAQPKPVSTSNQGAQPKPVSTSNQGAQPKPVSTSNQGVQPKPVSTSNQGAQPKPVSSSSQGAKPKPVSTSNQGAQPKPVSTSNQGAQPKPVSTSNQGASTNQASQTALNDAEIKLALTTTFHLLPDDANYVIKRHRDVALQVVKTANPVLTGIDFSFDRKDVQCPPAPQQCQISGAVDWDSDTEENVRRMLGQIIFIFNTPDFIKRFENAGPELMKPSMFTSGKGSANTRPNDYPTLKNAINSAINYWKSDGDNHTNNYHLYLYRTVGGGEAFGAVYKPEVMLHLDGMQNTDQNGLLHRSASLVAHELMHTVGYTHDNVQLIKPDNLPYYIQAITSVGGLNEADCPKFMRCLKTITLQVGNPPQPQPYSIPTINNAWSSDADLLDRTDKTFKNTNIFAMYFGSSNIQKRNQDNQIPAN